MNKELARQLGIAFALGMRLGRNPELANDAGIARKIIKWITVKGTHIPLDKRGVPLSKKGKEIFEDQKPAREYQQYKRTEPKEIKKQNEINKGIQAGEKSLKDGKFTDLDMKKLQGRYDSIAQRGRELYGDIEKVAKSLGASMIGKDFAVKQASSTQRKVIDRSHGKSDLYEEKFNRLSDLMRYTIMGRHESIPVLTKKVSRVLKEKGYNMVERSNRYLEKDPTYKGVHLKAIDPKTNVSFEIQIHSPLSMKYKDVNHLLYEKERLPETEPDEKAMLREQMKKNAAKIPQPKGIKRIREFDHANGASKAL